MNIDREAKALYRQTKKVWCPRLGDHISFNRKGFDHLTWKGNKRRSHKAQVERFALLEYAQSVIADPSVKISHSIWKRGNSQLTHY